jgi:hypothetical protein
MRTTVELPDDLFRKAKARAALQGRSLKDIVADGLKLVLQTREDAGPAAPRRTEFPIIKSKNRSRKVTPQMIEEAETALLNEEASTYGRFTGR